MITKVGGKVVAIIQARMGSTRLPGKVLAQISGVPVLEFMVRRVRGSKRCSEVWVATSDHVGDDPVVDLCGRLGVPVFRGSENDVLERYRAAAENAGADVVVRLTADCPFADPGVIDEAIAHFESDKFDYVSNVIRRSFPDGLDVEVFSRVTLERAARECADAKFREHVTPYMRSGSYASGKTGQFRIGHVTAPANFSHLRWTLDTPEDLGFFQKFSSLVPPDASWMDIIACLTKQPEFFSWNRTLKARMSPLTAPLERKPQMAPRSAQHLARALETIPLGSQTFSKSYLGWVIGASPLFAESAKGAWIKDIDGNSYVDYVMGLLPIVLGYADPDVDAAIIAQLERGTIASFATTLEAELAERLVSLIPCAEMVRFGKNGSDATTAAIRLARAHTGRDLILASGYHGWHDWYIGSTERKLGVPDAIQKLTLAFPFNDADKLESLLRQHGDSVAGIMIEPTGKTAPLPGYLAHVQELADRHGALLIFDEIITGFRVSLGGAQAHYGVTPDLACFGKAMGNGMPISAVVGRRDIMQLMEKVFVSMTFGGEALSLAASLATIDKLERENAVARMWALGDDLKDKFNGLFDRAGFGGVLKFVGDGWWPRLEVAGPPIDKPLFVALLRQAFNRAGLVIASSLNLALAHEAADVKAFTLLAAETALREFRSSVERPDPSAALLGRVAQSDFAVRA